MPARIEGDRELLDRLRKLGGPALAGTMREAVIRAAQPILDDMRQRIHSVSGDLAGSLGISLRNGKTGIWEGVRIGPQPPKGAHAHLVEFGHRQVTKDGRVVGNVPAHPFARPAIRAKRSEAIRIIEDRLREAVEEAAAK